MEKQRLFALVLAADMPSVFASGNRSYAIPPTIMLRKKAVFAVALVATVVVLTGKPTAQGIVDFWGPLQHLRSPAGFPVVAIHLARLCNGKTLIMGVERSLPYKQGFTGFVTPQTLQQVAAAPTTPITHQLTAMRVPVDMAFSPASPNGPFDINACGGSMFDEHGNLKVGGISRTYNSFVLGVPYSLKLDASGTVWTRLPNEYVGVGELGFNWRWYSTEIRVASPSLRKTLRLIMSGSTVVDVQRVMNPAKRYYANDSVELDDDSGINRLVVPHEQSHTDMRNPSGYSHAFYQPDGRQLIHGSSGRPIFLDWENGTLTPTPYARPGSEGVENPDDGSCATPLTMYWGDLGPYGQGSFAVAGGRAGTALERNLGLYNTRTGTWKYFDMGVPRNWCKIVLMPDGRLLILGGVALDGSSGQGKVQIFDPRTDTLVTGSSEMVTKRGYHTVAVLQLDGSFFVCSGWPHAFTEDNIGKGELTAGEAPQCQTYWPDYTLRARPYLAGVPATMALGSTISVVYYNGQNLRPLSSARLMGLPTDTHGYDAGYSSVELRVAGSVPIEGFPGFHLVTLELPQAASGNVAETAHILPPGCYNLVLLDDQGTPTQLANTKVVW